MEEDREVSIGWLRVCSDNMESFKEDVVGVVHKDQIVNDGGVGDVVGELISGDDGLVFPDDLQGESVFDGEDLVDAFFDMDDAEILDMVDSVLDVIEGVDSPGMSVVVASVVVVVIDPDFRDSRDT